MRERELGRDMRECDLIMKGGITSGVVYPCAIQEISKAYRLRSIGGSSAGAIAAAIASAAEFRRQDANSDDGFEQIGDLAGELGTVTRQVFQPHPKMRDLFMLLMAAVSDGGGLGSIVRAAVSIYRATFLVGGFLVLVSVLLGVAAGSFWLAVLGVVLSVLATGSLIALSIAKQVLKDLPQHDFGLCPGLTVPGNTGPGLTNWIADRIDEVAGRSLDGAPLTIGDLETHGIELAAMTTDLSSQRPYQLPLRSRHHFFSKAEFQRLFPARVVDYLCGDRNPGSSGLPDGPEDLYPLPIGAAFPVVLVARMSLSFPGLISAVPLWRRDYTATGPDGERGAYRRCLFSDGGISSNFPVLFFDALLPQRPTFGISLGSWDQDRDGDERVHLSDKPIQSTHMPVRTPKGLPGFLFSIVNTAKDWQDTLQSKLPGYAERIVEIRLDDSREGGMNLNMDPATIKMLTDYGRQAGKTLVDEFDFDENRWRRALSVLPAIESAFQVLHNAYVNVPTGGGPDAQSYAQILTTRTPQRYKNTQDWRNDVLEPFAARLADIGKTASETPKSNLQSGDIPSQAAGVRILATADRRPAEE